MLFYLSETLTYHSDHDRYMDIDKHRRQSGDPETIDVTSSQPPGLVCLAGLQQCHYCPV